MLDFFRRCHADARRPLVIGSLYNGRDKPGSEMLPDQKGGFAVLSDDRAYVHSKEDMTFKSDKGMVIVRLNSGETRYIRSDCMATVGAVSNPDNGNTNLAKAGRNRWLGKRPLTRGVAKNPVDHPHGGGEGRTSGGRHPVTPWGKPTKGARTRHNKATDKFIIRSRHAKKKG